MKILPQILFQSILPQSVLDLPVLFLRVSLARHARPDSHDSLRRHMTHYFYFRLPAVCIAMAVQLIKSSPVPFYYLVYTTSVLLIYVIQHHARVVEFVLFKIQYVFYLQKRQRHILLQNIRPTFLCQQISRRVSPIC